MSPPQDRRLDEAVAWHVRLASLEAGEALFTEFSAWLESDPANRAAYDTIEDFDAALGDHISQMHEKRSPQQPIGFERRPFAKPTSMAVWTLGVSAIAAVLAIFFLVSTTPPSAKRYATGIGQSRVVALSDGSKIEMNTATTLFVQESSRERRVMLERGEAAFRIHHEKDRPFIVHVGDREIRDMGTVFDVLDNGRTVLVAVAEGQIAVASATGGEPVQMHAGQRLVHTEGSRFSTLDTVDPRWVTAWRSGYLVYRNAPLRDVVADLNRYFRQPISVEEGAASGQHFSGVLRIRDENTAVAELTAFLPILAIRKNDGTIQLQAAKPKH